MDATLLIQELGGFLTLQEAATSGLTGKGWDVLIIEAGTSMNGNDYSAKVLEEAAPLFEGAPIRMFAFDGRGGRQTHFDHPPLEIDRIPGVAGNTVGFLRDVRLESRPSRQGGTTKALVGRAEITKPEVARDLKEAWDRGGMQPGRRSPFELSIVAEGPHTVRLKEGKAIKQVERLTKVRSVDIVSDGAAGGVFERIAASLEGQPAPSSVEAYLALVESLAASFGVSESMADEALKRAMGYQREATEQQTDSGQEFVAAGSEFPTQTVSSDYHGKANGMQQLELAESKYRKTLVQKLRDSGHDKPLDESTTQALGRLVREMEGEIGAGQGDLKGLLEKCGQLIQAGDAEGALRVLEQIAAMDEAEEAGEMEEGKKKKESKSDFDLERSDMGDGGWSLHPKGEDEILASGEAKMVNGSWNRPNNKDYAAAEKALSKLRAKSEAKNCGCKDNDLEEAKGKPFPGAAPPFGEKDEDDEKSEAFTQQQYDEQKEDIRLMGAQAAKAGEPRDPPERLAVMMKKIWLRGYDSKRTPTQESRDAYDRWERTQESKQEEETPVSQPRNQEMAREAVGTEDAPVTRQEMLEFARALGEEHRSLTGDLREAREQLAERDLREAIAASNSRMNVMLAESGLPPRTQDVVRKQFRNKLWEVDELREAIQDQAEALDAAVPPSARFAESAVPSGGGGFGGHFVQGASAFDYLQAEMDRCCGYDYRLDNTLTEAQKDVYRSLPRVPSIRRAVGYQWFGDPDCLLSNYVGPQALMRESANVRPSGTLLLAREAVVADLPTLLGTSQTRAVTQAWEQQEQQWRLICDVKPLANFKQQDRIIMGGYGRVPVVAEADSGTTYTSGGNPGESTLSYTAKKHGLFTSVSREAMLADDLGKIQMFPTRLAEALADELQRDVFNAWLGNAGGGGFNTDLSYDGVVYYNDAHDNITADAMSYDSVLEMRTRQDNQRMYGNLGTTASILLGASSLVANGTNAARFAEALNPGDELRVYGGTGGVVETVTVSTISGTTINITGTFAVAHSASSRVEQLSSAIKYPALWLIHPNELRGLAYQILNSTHVPGGALTSDVSALWPDVRDGTLKPLSLHKMFLGGSTTRYGMAAGTPIELGFVGGQETPQMLLQDNPIVNGMFSGDYFTWRARLEWGLLLMGHLFSQMANP